MDLYGMCTCVCGKLSRWKTTRGMKSGFGTRGKLWDTITLPYAVSRVVKVSAPFKWNCSLYITFSSPDIPRCQNCQRGSHRSDQAYVERGDTRICIIRGSHNEQWRTHKRRWLNRTRPVRTAIGGDCKPISDRALGQGVPTSGRALWLGYLYISFRTFYLSLGW